jgi:hypothetical protein
MLLEKSMDFHARLESQQMPNLRLRQALGPVAFHRQRFERRTEEVLAFRADLRGKLIRDVKGDFHVLQDTTGLIMEATRCSGISNTAIITMSIGAYKVSGMGVDLFEKHFGVPSEFGL